MGKAYVAARLRAVVYASSRDASNFRLPRDEP
jgi:hypothetical protein